MEIRKLLNVSEVILLKEHFHNAKYSNKNMIKISTNELDDLHRYKR